MVFANGMMKIAHEIFINYFSLLRAFKKIASSCYEMEDRLCGVDTLGGYCKLYVGNRWEIDRKFIPSMHNILENTG